MLLFKRLFVALFCLSCGSVMAAAPEWPQRPIRLVVPFAPGGATDIVARILAPSMSEVLGQQVVVDNRTGAAGNIALEITGRAQPDGYTVLIGNVSTNSINQLLFASTLKIDPSKDLKAVTLLASVPNVIVSGAGFPPNTLKELVAYAKARPGGLNYSSPLGGYSHLDMLDFNKRAGIEMVNVPSKGAGSSQAAIIGGEIHFSIVNAASSMPQIKAGRMKAFATTSAKRIPELPDVPTMAEGGYPGVGSNNWNGFFVQAATPQAIVDKLHATVLAVVAKPQVQEAMAKSGVPIVTSKSPAEFQQFVNSEVQRWQRIIKENNVKVE